MLKTILQIFCLILCVLSINGYSQTRHDGFTISCPYNHKSGNIKVPPPQAYKDYIKRSNLRTSNTPKNAEFIVTYVGFENFPEAQAAYQFAVDVWSSLLYSDVPIYLRAGFGGLESGVLAQAGPGALFSDFQGAANDTTIYHVAMAEKMARRDLNEPGAFDIVATFSDEQNWYFGTDGNPRDSQFEFIATVIHEIGHGLGFSALDNVDNEGIGVSNPGAYNNYIINGSGVSIYDIENNSAALGSYLQSNDLFLNSRGAIQENNGQPAEIYAPSSYNGGSSISHLGEIFNNTENACMTFSGSPGESILDPGPLVTQFFYDLGWLGSTIIHEDEDVIEGFDDALTFTLNMSSDIGFESGFNIPKLTYSFDDFQTQSTVDMALSADGLYTSSIPNPGETASISYYFDGVKDSLRSYTLPSGVFKEGTTTNPFTATVVSSEASDLSFTLEMGGNFETEGNFNIVNIGKGLTNLWEKGAPTNILNTPSSGTNVWKTNLDANLTKPDQDIISGLLTPKFNLSDELANYTLGFDLTMDDDQGALFASLVYTTDQGASWNFVGDNQDNRGENWFNVALPDYPGGVGYGWSLDNADDGGAMTVSYNISNLAGTGNVRFAIVAFLKSGLSTESYEIDGIMVDDFQLIKELPKAEFWSSAESALSYPGDSIQFEFLSNGASSYAWDFGDGNSSSEQNPGHAYEDGGDYTVSLTITYANGSNTSSSIISVAPLFPSNYTLEDGGDFETNAGDFYADNISGTGWELGNSEVRGKNGTSSGNFAWVTGITQTEYTDQSEGFLYTPRYDFRNLGNYEISFRAKYDTEQDWDGFILEYTIDNEITWNQLEPEVGDSWYDGVANDNPEQGWSAVPIFSGSTNGEFALKTRDISSLSGQASVGFRFHWKSDFATTGVGVAIDDFQLMGPEGVVSVDFSANTTELCSGAEATFMSALSGEIKKLTWDFGSNANPQTASGVGPHNITYTSDVLISNSVKLTAVNSDGVATLEEKTGYVKVAPGFQPTITGDLETIPVILTSSQGEAYQWLVDGDTIENATSRTLEVTNKGAYAVLVNISGCTKVSDEVVVNIVLSTNSPSDRLSVYPNPVTEAITLTLNEASDSYQYDISMYTLTGQRILTKRIEGVQSTLNQTISVKELSSGTYILKIQDENNLTIAKRILVR